MHERDVARRRKPADHALDLPLGGDIGQPGLHSTSDRPAGHASALYVDGPGLIGLGAEHGAHQRPAAGAVRADQRNDLPGIGCEGNVVVVTLAREVAHFDGGLHLNG